MPLLLRLNDTIALYLFRLACLLIFGIVVLVNYDVIARNLDLPPAFWAVSTVEYTMLFVTFLCLPYLVLTRGHVCVEILLTYMPTKLRKLWELGLHIISALVCFYLMAQSAELFWKVWLDGSYEIRTYDMPMWALYATMPIGFGFGGLQFLAFLVKGESFFGASPEAHAGL